jgi:hypothetical protein
MSRNNTALYNQRLQFKDFIPIAICIFLSFTQLKTLVPFIPSLVVMALGAIYTFFVSRKFYLQSYIMWLFIYALVVVINCLFGDYYFDRITNVIEEIFVLTIPAALTYYIIKSDKLLLGKSLMYAFMFLIIYSAITTYLVVMIYPDAVRLSVYYLNIGDTETLNRLYGMGMVTYRFPHALPAFIPALVYMLKKSGKISLMDKKKKRFMRVMALTTLFFLLLVIYLSNATMATLLAIMILLASFFVVGKNNEVNVPVTIVLSLVFLPLIFSTELLTNIINYVGSLLGQETLYTERFEEIKNYSQSGSASGDFGSRIDKYDISFTRFLENPIIGTDKSTGGHSAIFDRLACLGLVGWIPYILYIILIIKRQGKMLSQKIVFFFYLGIVAAIFMLATKNMSNWDTWFVATCMLPVSMWVIEKETQNLEINQ